MVPLILLLLALISQPALAAPACERVPAHQEPRRANAGCVIVRQQQVLLLTHRASGKLGVPGGTREGDETAQCTAHRETWEETGIAVTVGKRLGVMKNGFHLYRCHLQEPLPQPLALPAHALNEIRSLGWYRLADLSKQDMRFPYQFDKFVQVIESQFAPPHQ